MIIKLLNSILLFDLMRGKKSGNMPSRRRDKEFVPAQATEKTAAIPVSTGEFPTSEIKKTRNGSIVTFEGTYQGKPIRVRIYNESI